MDERDVDARFASIVARWDGPVPDDDDPPADDAPERPTAEPAADEVTDGEPPEVVLPPQEDLHFWGAVIGLVAGPLMLLWVVFARPSHTTRWFVVSVIVSLVGFGLLVLRQPKHRDP